MTDEFIWFISDRTGKELKRRHGLSSTYRLGCQCHVCWSAHVKKCKAYRLKLVQNGGSRLQDAPLAPIREHIRMLRDDKGMSYAAISRQAGMADTSVSQLMNGLRKAVYPETAEKILAIVGPDDSGWTEGGYISPDLSAKRLQSMVALGYSLTSLRRMVGYENEDTYHRIAGGRVNNIQVSVAREIRELYRKIGDTAFVHTNRREKASRTVALNRAKTEGWGVPATWNDPGTLIVPDDWDFGGEDEAEVDSVVVDRLIARGNDGFMAYTYGERSEAVRAMRERKFPNSEIRTHLKLSTRTFNRILGELEQ